MSSSILGCQRTEKPVSYPLEAVGKSVAKTEGFKKLTALVTNALSLLQAVFRSSYRPLINVITYLKACSLVMGPFELIDRLGDWFVPREKMGRLMVETATTQKIAGRLFLTGANIVEALKFFHLMGFIQLGKIAANVAIKSIIFSPLLLAGDAFLLLSSSFGIWDGVKKMKSVDRKNTEAQEHLSKWKTRAQQSREELLKEYKNKYFNIVNGLDEPICKENGSRAEKLALYVAALDNNSLQQQFATAGLVRYYTAKYKQLHNGKGDLIDSKSGEQASKYIYYAQMFENDVEKGVRSKSDQKAIRWNDIKDARIENGKKEKTRSWVSIAADIAKIVSISLGLFFTFSGLAAGVGALIASSVFLFAASFVGYVNFLNKEYTKLKPEVNKSIVPNSTSE